jgi:copper chaperone
LSFVVSIREAPKITERTSTFLTLLQIQKMSEKHIRLHIEGMTCGHCQKTVNDVITRMKGVSKVSVTLTPGEAEVEFDDSVTSAPSIVAAIDGTEVYSASLI